MSEYIGTGYDNWPEPAGGNYLRLKKKGDKCRIRIVGLPIFFKEEVKEEGKDAKLVNKWAFPVISKRKDESGNVVKEFMAFQCGASVANEIRRLRNHEEWGDPIAYDIEIERTEKSPADYYTVVASPNKKPLQEDDMELLEANGYDASDDFWAENWLGELFLKDKS